jgi:arylsulfatase A-like enzyme
MTGKMPSSTGIYNNSQWWKPHLSDAVTIPEYFRRHGYTAVGAGKVHHHTPGFNPPGQWDDYREQVFDNPWRLASYTDQRYHDYGYRGSKPVFPKWWPLNGVAGLGAENDWGALPDKTEGEYGDQVAVEYARQILADRHDQPFFLAVGFYRPHLPWYVPQRFFDMYDEKDIVLPDVPSDDLNDVPDEGIKLSRANREDYLKIRDAGQWKQAVRAYLASISYADSLLGQVVDALDASAYRDNTIIVLWSDHGWHLGEKQHWHKSTLWEEATRVPLIIVAPGVASAGVDCDRPVGLIDLYPTLIDLCGLDRKQGLDGVSLRPLLVDPDREWDRPAVTVFKPGQAAVRSQQFRYIRYESGGEELYDHSVDPQEWRNLADDPRYADTKRALSRWLPGAFAEPAPAKNAYHFDPSMYTWTVR